MQDDKANDPQAVDAPFPQFLALSLRDGLDAERVYHRGSGLDRSNSSFLHRCRNEITENGFHHVTVYNLWQEVRELLSPYDPEKQNLERFLKALRTGQNNAVGYLPPRATDALPVLIPATVWDHCRIDWDTADITGAGLQFSDVRILISARVFESNHLFYSHQPVILLAAFAPSDDQRRQLCIPSAPMPQSVTDEAERSDNAPTEGKTGRPSFKPDIKAAFDIIEKDLNWTDKELAQVVRQHVKTQTGKQDDKGLGDDAILKHLRPQWHALKQLRP